VSRATAAWAAGVLLAAGAALATVPFLVSGHLARTRVEGLPALARDAGLPLRLDLLDYEQGLYLARFALAVHPAGVGPEAVGQLEAQVRHGLLGVAGTATVHPATLTWSDALPGLDLTVSPTALSVVADTQVTEVSLDLEGLTLSTRAGASGLPPLRVAVSAIRLKARLQGHGEDLAADVDLSADQVESRGVPYLRLTGVRGSAQGVLAPHGTAPLSLHLQADSNYGEVRARLTLQGAAPGEAVDAALEVEAPSGLARLLLSRDPGLAERWRRAGALQDTGPRASLRLRGPVSAGLY